MESLKAQLAKATTQAGDMKAQLAQLAADTQEAETRLANEVR
jgi:hypothetical protein